MTNLTDLPTPDIPDGHPVDTVVVLVRTIAPDGAETLHLTQTAGTSRLLTLGMLTDARDGYRVHSWAANPTPP